MGLPRDERGPDEVAFVLDQMEQAGSVAYARECLFELAVAAMREADNAVGSLPVSDARDMLLSVTGYALEQSGYNGARGSYSTTSAAEAIPGPPVLESADCENSTRHGCAPLGRHQRLVYGGGQASRRAPNAVRLTQASSRLAFPPAPSRVEQPLFAIDHVHARS